MTEGPVLRPMAEPLRLAAIELADLARLGDELQHLVAELAVVAGASAASVLIRAQAADLLSQRLEGMAAFLRTLADAAPGEALIDVHAAVMDLTVAEQARRLAGPHGPNAVCAASDEGELVMFGE